MTILVDLLTYAITTSCQLLSPDEDYSAVSAFVLWTVAHARHSLDRKIRRANDGRSGLPSNHCYNNL